MYKNSPSAFLEICEQHEEELNQQLENTGLKNRKTVFDPDIITQLPDILRAACSIFSHPAEQEVFLVGALGVLSGILPNIRGFYDGKFYSPHLYVFILGKYGVGKGGLGFAKILGQEIHRKHREETEAAKEQYIQQKREYERDLKAFYKSKNQLADPPEMPEEPPEKMLFIPANNSRTGVFQLLEENNGTAIIFETEGDTIADTLKQDYGNFSDGLRKAFHHETISYYRRTNKEYVEIKAPSIAVVLSSTYDQLYNLIPTIQNGLFSRFIFYQLEGDHKFRNVFNQQKVNYPLRFGELAILMLNIYERLSDLDQPVSIKLSEQQQQRFLEYFERCKEELLEFVSDDLEGTVNRLGLICFRIILIFTTLRHFEDGKHFADILQCEEQDFNNALRLIEIFKQQSVKVFYKMPEGRKENQRTQLKIDPKKQQALALRGKGQSYGEIAKKLKTSKTTIYRWING